MHNRVCGVRLSSSAYPDVFGNIADESWHS